MSTEAWISLSATIIVAGIAVLLARETALLAAGRPPVTTVVRSIVVRWPAQAVGIGSIVVFAVGLFFAHFIWDAGLL